MLNKISFIVEVQQKQNQVLPVGTYSWGKWFSAYVVNRQVFPTAPSPTTTNLMVLLFSAISVC